MKRIHELNGNLNSLSTLELLEVVGCDVDNRNGFNAWCESHDVFEFLTQDYITSLTSYLKTRAASLTMIADDDEQLGEGEGKTKDDSLSKEKRKGDKFTILELGAGNGRLAFFLRRQLMNSGHGKTKSSNFKKTKKSNKNSDYHFQNKAAISKQFNSMKIEYIAIDHGGWSIRKNATSSDLGVDGYVEKLDYQKALLKYQPDLVLVSWMPMGEDWTRHIRNMKSVQEYILIGETDDGCCGHNFETWGNSDFKPSSLPQNKVLSEESNNNNSKEEEEEVGGGELVIAPYAVDDWERVNHDEMSSLQLCRFDSEDFVGNSKTVSFTRK